MLRGRAAVYIHTNNSAKFIHLNKLLNFKLF